MASDWNPKLGDDVFLLYACKKCGYAPLKQHHWYRCVKIKYLDDAGQTVTGTDHGYWVCANRNCLAQWSWGEDGAYRVLVLPEETAQMKTIEPEEGQPREEWHRVVYLGKATADEEHTITILKSAQVMKLVDGDGQAINIDDAIVAAIEKLNEEADKKLIELECCRRLQAGSAKDLVEKYGWQPYCENQSKSIGAANISYNALKTGKTTPMIADAFRQRVLNALVCFYDFTAMEKPETPSLRRAWRQAIQMQEENRQIYFPQSVDAKRRRTE